MIRKTPQPPRLMSVPEEQIDRLRKAFMNVAPLQKKWPALYDTKELHRAIVSLLKSARSQ